MKSPHFLILDKHHWRCPEFTAYVSCAHVHMTVIPRREGPVFLLTTMPYGWGTHHTWWALIRYPVIW